MWNDHHICLAGEDIRILRQVQSSSSAPRALLIEITAIILFIIFFISLIKNHHHHQGDGVHGQREEVRRAELDEYHPSLGDHHARSLKLHRPVFHLRGESKGKLIWTSSALRGSSCV